MFPSPDPRLPAGREQRALGRVLVFSPHLDDAVFACGELLSTLRGAVVATVFAGRAPADASDAAATHGPAPSPDDTELARRREEDRNALAVIGARPLWLRFPAAPAWRPSVEDLAEAVRAIVAQEQVDTVLVPLGLADGDHELVHDAAIRVMERDADRRWIAYEDAILRRRPGVLQRRLVELHERGVVATPVPLRGAGRKPKRVAVQCYASRTRALAVEEKGLAAELASPEGYWHLVRSADATIRRALAR